MQQVFPWAHQVVDANGISIASAVFAGLTRWQTDWQTDRPRYSSVAIGEAHSGEAIFLLSTAATSIYWSSWLDRSDQRQQLAAIFSCKIGLQCMWRHTTIYLKQSVSHRRTRQVTQLFTYLLTHKLFSSCIRRYLVSHFCDWVMPALSTVLLTFSFQLSLLFCALTQHDEHVQCITLDSI